MTNESEAEHAAARRALAALDLTLLGDSDTESDIRALAARGRTAHGPVAALCLWPRFVSLAKELVAGTPIRVATVANFPSGRDDPRAVTAAIVAALGDGADEIDVVMPYEAMMSGEEGRVRAVLEAARAAMPGTFKVILETGVLETPERISAASRLALDAGADFLKTSTGKTAVSATPEAAQALLEAVRDSGRDAGVKISGGVRTTAQAAAYLAQADRIMGEGWAKASHFRFGASGLLDALLATLDGTTAPAAGKGY